MRTTEYFNNVNKSIIVAIGILLVFLMGLLDYITGVELAFSIFYLIPISFVAFYAGKYQGLFIAVLSTIVWLGADITEVHRYANQAIPYWNALVRFGFFIIVLFLVNELRILNLKLEQKVKERTTELSTEIQEREKTEYELKYKSEKLRQLIRRTQKIKEEEDIKIAREIHDELGQALTAIKIEAITLTKKYTNNKKLSERLFTIANTVDDLIKAIRDISTRLRPRLLDELGLLPAIEWKLKDTQCHTGIHYKLIAKEDNVKLCPTTSNSLYRIFQEAITNITRHAEATNIIVRINHDPKCKENLVMEILDNGIGLPYDYQEKNHGLGILGMKERAQILGGDVEVISAEDWGTAVIVKVPIHENGELRK